MLKVIIIGSGNVAQHLIRAFEKSASAEIVQAYARHPEKLSGILSPDRVIDSLEDLIDADAYIISVSDDAIADITAKLPFEGRFVAHTSGSVDLVQADAKNRRGVFYPLQTFSKSRPVDFSKVPFCLEAEHEPDYAILDKLAAALSPIRYVINSKQRQALHVAAVFVNNFTNHLYALGNDICKENNMPFDILKPLIAETAAKVQELAPLQAQTGPAVRHDAHTIARHLAFLEDDNQKNIYRILTQSIQQADVQKL